MQDVYKRQDYPSWLCTGTEDYPATAWLLNPFAHRYTGCLLCDEAGGRFQIYRLHVPDPIYFCLLYTSRCV